MNERLQKLLYDFVILPVWKALDLFVAKEDHYWAFSVHHIKSDQFIENQRALFEAVKKEPGIKKIIFTRTSVDGFGIEDAVNTEIAELYTWRGLTLFLKCRVIFVTHSIAMDYSKRYGKKLFSPIRPWLGRRVAVNLWHGIALKRLLALANDEVRNRTDRSAFRRKERRYYAGLITSSDVDSYAMATMFYPIKYDAVWVSGLPKNDFLLQSEERLPGYMKDSLRQVQNLKQGRKLIVYAPTYRQTSLDASQGYYTFAPAELARLKEFLKDNNAVLGLRMHYFRNDEAVQRTESMIDGERIVDLGHEKFPEIGMVMRAMDYLITDYSSVYMDAMYLDKPMFSFAYDLENYKTQQDGLLYEMDLAFPGPVVESFDALIEVLESEMLSPSQSNGDRYQMAKKIFYSYSDDQNAQRVVDFVERALEKRAE